MKNPQTLKNPLIISILSIVFCILLLLSYAGVFSTGEQFHYHDKVIIIDGFYKGVEGKVWREKPFNKYDIISEYSRFIDNIEGSNLQLKETK